MTKRAFPTILLVSAPIYDSPETRALFFNITAKSSLLFLRQIPNPRQPSHIPKWSF